MSTHLRTASMSCAWVENVLPSAGCLPMRTTNPVGDSRTSVRNPPPRAWNGPGTPRDSSHFARAVFRLDPEGPSELGVFTRSLPLAMGACFLA